MSRIFIITILFITILGLHNSLGKNNAIPDKIQFTQEQLKVHAGLDEGFRGIQWGTDLQTMLHSGFSLLDSEAIQNINSYYLTRSGESLNLFGVPVTYIVYLLDRQTGFCGVYIGYDNFNHHAIVEEINNTLGTIFFNEYDYKPQKYKTGRTNVVIYFANKNNKIKISTDTMNESPNEDGLPLPTGTKMDCKPEGTSGF